MSKTRSSSDVRVDSDAALHEVSAPDVTRTVQIGLEGHIWLATFAGVAGRRADSRAAEGPTF